MTLEEILAAVKALQASVDANATQIAALDKKFTEEPVLKASLECRAAVEPHAAALDAAASGLKAAGIGSHATQGHSVILTKMAGHLRAQAAMGNMPHIFNEYDIRSAADAGATQEDGTMDAETKKALDGLKASQEVTNKAVTDLAAALTTLSTDLKANLRHDAPAPERKTLPPSITAMLDRFSIKHTGEDGKPMAVNTDALSAAMKAGGIEPEKRMEIINSVDRANRGQRS